MRHKINDALADLRATTTRRHVRFGPCCNGGVATRQHSVEENKLFNVDDLLDFFPFFALFDNIFAMLFGGVERFFSM